LPFNTAGGGTRRRFDTVNAAVVSPSTPALPSTTRGTEWIMDFVERWFGVAPDAGSGWLEAAYLVVATGLVAFCVAWRRRMVSVHASYTGRRRRPRL